MLTYKQIVDKIYDHFFELKRLNCEGCIYNNPSQIRHLVCLYDYNSEWYLKLAIDLVRVTLKEEDKELFESVAKELTDE